MTKGIDFGKQIGPLPLGAWLAAGAAGLTLGYYVNHKRGAAAATAAATAPSDPVAGGGEVAGIGGGSIDTGGVVALPNGASGSGVAGGGVASSGDRPTFQDNDAWAAYATTILVARGFAPILVTKAIADLMNGVQLDRQEAAAIDLVIRIAGPPPIAVPPISTLPAPATTPTPTGAGPRGALDGMPYFANVPGATVVKIVWRHDNRGGYALDNWGGMHPVNRHGQPLPPQPRGGPYWPGAVTGHAVDIYLNPNDNGGRVVDQLGGLHPFTIAPITAPITTDGKVSA